ncbi:hypothetical protein C8R45DRAFT_942570 [Mycena sanguinolenta]|nr:hypothetical protein C8R45DRAFT_942570 [Mycena sanguinolenta]
MSDAPNFRPEILRSALYWRDFQQRRARIADCAQCELAPGEVHLSAGAVTSQPPIITFIPNRDVPVYGLVQNNGTLACSYDPNCIQPVAPPPRGGGPAINKLPARCDPPPCPGSLEDHRRRAACKYLTKGPSEDEKLLQRLTLGSRASKSASSQSPSSQTHPITPISAPVSEEKDVGVGAMGCGRQKRRHAFPGAQASYRLDVGSVVASHTKSVSLLFHSSWFGPPIPEKRSPGSHIRSCGPIRKCECHDIVAQVQLKISIEGCHTGQMNNRVDFPAGYRA